MLLKTVTAKMTLESGVTKWGESNLDAYQRYLDWLLKAGVLKARVEAREIVTNALVGPVNDKLDLKAVETALAK